MVPVSVLPVPLHLGHLVEGWPTKILSLPSQQLQLADPDECPGHYSLRSLLVRNWDNLAWFVEKPSRLCEIGTTLACTFIVEVIRLPG